MEAVLQDVDMCCEAFGDWTEAGFDQTLVPLGHATALPSTMATTQGITKGYIPSSRSTLTLPQSTLDQIDLTFYRGAEAQNRASETVVPTGSKYLDKQMLHLIAFQYTKRYYHVEFCTCICYRKTQLWEEQEVHNGTTIITISDVKASKRKCTPPFPQHLIILRDYWYGT